MLKSSLVIYIGSAFAGLIEGSKMLDSVEAITLKANSRYGVFQNIVISSIFTATVGCSQSVAVMLTHMLNKKAYEKNELDNSFLAIDLEYINNDFRFDSLEHCFTCSTYDFRC
ncbi:hypothetical protein [Clostridium estertheticum]|uniref:hypothetical protein n=1 Tax=Clostridium estertheticum TaxID=238834 RepID=UPI0021E29240|nr:hypothetical protein [Clostridium estertheticum]